MRKGFTLIELMIVVAIIAIIAAIALPSLIQSRMQANETNAAASLRAYATAQATYKKANYAAANGLSNRQYCPTISGLANHVNAAGSALALIPPPFAEADSGNGNPVAYNGYLFTPDALSDWQDQFGAFARPGVYGKTGVNTFYIGTDGTVYMSDTQGQIAPADPFDPVGAQWTAAQ